MLEVGHGRQPPGKDDPRSAVPFEEDVEVVVALSPEYVEPGNHEGAADARLEVAVEAVPVAPQAAAERNPVPAVGVTQEVVGPSQEGVEPQQFKRTYPELFLLVDHEEVRVVVDDVVVTEMVATMAVGPGGEGHQEGRVGEVAHDVVQQFGIAETAVAAVVAVHELAPHEEPAEAPVDAFHGQGLDGAPSVGGGRAGPTGKIPDDVQGPEPGSFDETGRRYAALDVF